LRRARVLRDQLTARFLDPRSGTLREYFTADWRQWPRADGECVEPGHHAEWAWLIRYHERLAGWAPDPLAARLLDFAVGCGNPATGFLPDEVAPDGSVRAASLRCWPQAELAKAWLAEAANGRRHADVTAWRILSGISERFLAGPVPGAWTDRLDASGRPAVEFIPASTFYHVFSAIAEAHQFSMRAADKG
jgi:mannose-6-phosphate isomerase